MSGTFPSTPAPSEFAIWAVQPTRLSVAHSLKRNARTTNAQRWRMRLSFATRERADIDPIIAFVESQRGRYDTFTYGLPRPLNAPRGIGATGSPGPMVNGNLISPTGDVQVGRSIVTSGWPLNSAILKAGDFLKFSSHTKLYRVTADATSGATGTATISINPAAVEPLAHGDAISTNGLAFNVCLAADESGLLISPGPLFRLDDLEFMEVY